MRAFRHYVENAPMNLLQGQDATCPLVDFSVESAE
jgi:hypothetical protein